MLDFAKCPVCETKMLLLPRVLEGIPEDAEGIDKEGIRIL